MNKLAFIILAAIIPLTGAGQDSTKKFSFDGYASVMTSALFDSLSGQFINDNLIHNRLNFKAYVSSHASFALEMRNRLFTGDMVKSGKSYSDLISNDAGLIDMSWNIVNKQSFFLNSTIDRLWFDLNYDKFQARVGRQRINWGQALVWNPNDIFNAYSYFDFDYVERPGSDAIRLQYYPDASSNVEFAIKANNTKKITAAILYRFNKWAYDIQFLGGVFNNDEFVAGTGWSGAFGSTSFRGEVSWFKPFQSNRTGTVMLTAGLDRAFKNNSTAQLQVLYSNHPTNPGNLGALYQSDMTVKDLAFSKISAFGSYTYPVTPLFNITASSMWFPDLHGFFGGFSMDYSLAENIDLTFLWQHFNEDAGIRINILFLRFKVSF